MAKTLYEIPQGLADEILLVDDASPDKTVEVAKKLNLKVKVHSSNRGYGGNQKTCYDWALKNGGEIIVLLHPDYQYDPKTLPALIKPLEENQADFVFGSRFRERGNPLKGGMPLYRYLGNRLTTFLENLILSTSFSELHSGLRAYKKEFLESIDYQSFSDNFVFDSQMLVDAVLCGFKIKEVPIPTRYQEDSSSVSIKESLRYITQTLLFLLAKKLFPTCYPVVLKNQCNFCGQKHSKVFLIKRGSPIVRCQGCGLVYAKNPSEISPQVYEETYFKAENFPGKVGYRNYLADESLHRAYFRKKLKQILKFKNKGKLLDVGCALGFFLDEARKKGFEVQGLDISSFAVNFARQKLKLNVLLGDLGEVSLPANHFEVVTAFEVIEHLEKPLRFFKEIERILKKGGLFFVTTPNQGGILAKIMGGFWFSYKPPEHLYFFSSKTLKKMAEKAGFEVEIGSDVWRSYFLFNLIERIGYYYPGLGWLSRALLRLLRTLRLEKVSVPVCLDYIWLVAKKK